MLFSTLRLRLYDIESTYYYLFYDYYEFLGILSSAWHDVLCQA